MANKVSKSVIFLDLDGSMYIGAQINLPNKLPVYKKHYLEDGISIEANPGLVDWVDWIDNRVFGNE